MKTLVMATGNADKVREVREMLPDFTIYSMKDIGFVGDIDESADTTAGNAQIKVDTVYEFCKAHNLSYGVIGDDAGLFIKALDGHPGVHSARFGGMDHKQPELRRYILKLMENKKDRSAYFESSIVYKDDKFNTLFVGRAYGEITQEEIGGGDFGYDPIFYSYDLKKTFSEAEGEEKDSVSHRGRAVRDLKEFLDNYIK